jgi:CDP-glucose 4,6-dehydratase
VERGHRALEAVVAPSFWHGRRVLVTGHTGFKGAWLSLWLRDLGAEVTGFSLGAPSEPALFDLARVGEGMRSLAGDVRDLGAVERAVAQSRAEVVLHLAAQPIVRRSFHDPVGTYATNVMGTVHVLDAARRSGEARVVINVTSDKCYENREWLWGYREYEPMGGHDPYSSSKGCSELVTAAYRNSFASDPDGLRLASARAGNVIGGGDWGEDRLIPDLMRAALAGDTAIVRRPGAIRPWQHVLNPLSGYLLLAQGLWEQPAHAEGWNFGPDELDARPVEWIADRLASIWGEGFRWRNESEAAAPHEATYLKLDSSKARARLGWAPAWDLDAALAAIVQWYEAFHAGEEMREVTLAQISDYAAAEGASTS